MPRREGLAEPSMPFAADALASSDPAVEWEMPAAPSSAWKRTALSAVYRLGRAGYYGRRYDFAETPRGLGTRGER